MAKRILGGAPKKWVHKRTLSLLVFGSQPSSLIKCDYLRRSLFSPSPHPPLCPLSGPRSAECRVGPTPRSSRLREPRFNPDPSLVWRFNPASALSLEIECSKLCGGNYKLHMTNPDNKNPMQIYFCKCSCF